MSNYSDWLVKIKQLFKGESELTSYRGETPLSPKQTSSWDHNDELFLDDLAQDLANFISGRNEDANDTSDSTDDSSHLPSLNTQNIKRKWPEILASLQTVLPNSIGTQLEPLEERLIVNDNVVSVYIGDTDDPKALIGKAQSILESAIKERFGNDVQFQFKSELVFDEVLETESEQLPSIDELVIIAPDDESELADIFNEQPLESMQQKVKRLTQDKERLESKLEREQYIEDSQLRLIAICGELGQVLTKIQQLTKDDSLFTKINQVYDTAIDYAHCLYQIPVWKETTRSRLLESVPLLTLVERILTATELFTRKDSEPTAVIFEYHGADFRDQLSDTIYTVYHEWDDNLTRVEQISRHRGSGALNALLSEKTKRAYFLAVKGLLRENTKFGWKMLRGLEERGFTPIVFLEAEIVADMLLSERNTAHLANTFLRKWVGRQFLFSTTKVVHGFDFYGRRQELELFVKQIDSGENIHLVGLRRSGKTSLITHLGETLLNAHPLAIVDSRQFDEQAATCAELSRRLAASLWYEARKRYPHENWSIDDFRFKIRQSKYSLRDFEHDIEHLIERLPTYSIKAVIVVDEIDLVLPPDGEFEEWWDFLKMVYELRERLDRRLIFITIGRLPIIAEDNLAGRPNYFHSDYVHRLSGMLLDDCRVMIEDLSLPLGVDFTTNETTFEQVMQLTGGHSFLIRDLCGSVIRNNTNYPLVVTPEMIQSASVELQKNSLVLRSFAESLEPLESQIVDSIIRLEGKASFGLLENILVKNNDENEPDRIKKAVFNLQDLGLVDWTESNDIFIRMKLLEEMLKKFIIPPE